MLQYLHLFLHLVRRGLSTDASPGWTTPNKTSDQNYNGGQLMTISLHVREILDSG